MSKDAVRAYYASFGEREWQRLTNPDDGTVAFFELQAGLRLALWPRESLAHDAGLPVGMPSATELSLGQNVASKAEVDAVMEQAIALEHRLSSLPRRPSGAAMWATFKTPISTFGTLSGTRS